MYQRARRLAADQNDVAFPDLLEPRGQRSVLYLDREELERLLVIGAGHAVGSQQRLALDFQSDHRELAVLEAEAGIARRGEAEQGIGPVPDRQNRFLLKCAHCLS
ncbi:hypothetical protein ACVW04_005601 [Bradyrhizobium sp. LM2.3]